MRAQLSPFGGVREGSQQPATTSTFLQSRPSSIVSSSLNPLLSPNSVSPLPFPRPATHHSTTRGPSAAKLNQSRSAANAFSDLFINSSNRPPTGAGQTTTIASATFSPPFGGYVKGVGDDTNQPQHQQKRAATSSGSSRAALMAQRGGSSTIVVRAKDSTSLLSATSSRHSGCESLIGSVHDGDESEAPVAVFRGDGTTATLAAAPRGRHYSLILQADRDRHRSELDGIWQRLERAETEAKKAQEELKHYQYFVLKAEMVSEDEQTARSSIIHLFYEGLQSLARDLTRLSTSVVQHQQPRITNAQHSFETNTPPSVITVRDSDLMRALKATQHRLQEAEALLGTVPVPVAAAGPSPYSPTNELTNQPSSTASTQWYLRLSELASTEYRVVPDHIMDGILRAQRTMNAIKSIPSSPALIASASDVGAVFTPPPTAGGPRPSRTATSRKRPASSASQSVTEASKSSSRPQTSQRAASKAGKQVLL